MHTKLSERQHIHWQRGGRCTAWQRPVHVGCWCCSVRGHLPPWRNSWSWGALRHVNFHNHLAEEGKLLPCVFLLGRNALPSELCALSICRVSLGQRRTYNIVQALKKSRHNLAPQVYTWRSAAVYEGAVREGLRHGSGRLVLMGGAASDSESPHSTPARPATASQAIHALRCEPGGDATAAAGSQQSCAVFEPAAGPRAAAGSPAGSAESARGADTGCTTAVQSCSAGLAAAAAACSPVTGLGGRTVPVGGGQAGADCTSAAGGCAAYDGEWRAGERHGRGRLRYAAAAGGGEYDGAWQHDVRHGVGRMVRCTSLSTASSTALLAQCAAC